MYFTDKQLPKEEPMELMSVDNPGGHTVITQAAFEMTVQRHAHLTLGNLRDRVNERAETEHRSLTWVQCIASLADFDFNVDHNVFSVDYAMGFTTAQRARR